MLFISAVTEVLLLSKIRSMGGVRVTLLAVVLYKLIKEDYSTVIVVAALKTGLELTIVKD